MILATASDEMPWNAASSHFADEMGPLLRKSWLQDERMKAMANGKIRCFIGVLVEIFKVRKL
jgi:hypothetical protein